jgi:hypothetical protein
MQLTQYNKAIVPLVVAVIAGILSHFGILPTMTIQDALTLLVTAAAVYIVPNTKS